MQIFHDMRFTADFRENIPEWNFSPKVFREIHMCERGPNACSNLRNWLILRRKLNYFRNVVGEYFVNISAKPEMFGRFSL